MSISPAVCRLQETLPIPWEPDTFVFRWALDDTAIEIWDPVGIGDLGATPEVTAVLPATVAKVDENREWNRSSDPNIGESGVSEPKITHHTMIGPNNLVGRHSLMGTTRYDDTRNPFGYLWDWRVNNMIGPLTLPLPQRFLDGFIKKGLHLYFVGVDESSLKAQLYRTNHDLTDPQGGGDIGFEVFGGTTDAIPAARSIERFMSSGNFMCILESPPGASGNAFAKAWVWDITLPGTPVQAAVVSVGNYFYASQRGDQPSQVLTTADTFSILSAQPHSIDSVSPSLVQMTNLFNTGSWGSQLFGPTLESGFTVLDDGNTVLYYFQKDGPPTGSSAARRIWRTGVVTEATFDFDFAAFGGGTIGVSKLFPFEE